MTAATPLRVLRAAIKSPGTLAVIGGVLRFCTTPQPPGTVRCSPLRTLNGKPPQ